MIAPPVQRASTIRSTTDLAASTMVSMSSARRRGRSPDASRRHAEETRMTDPVTELDARYGEDGATATPWAVAQQRLEMAPLYWLTTARADGRPHTTPLLAVWQDAALYFCTGPDEQKAKNLEQHRQCSLLTGCNALDQGLDLVVEGRAERVTDDGALRRLAAAWETKYGAEWHFDVRDGAFHHEGGAAHVYEVAPTVAYGFGKGPYSHTRWRFGAA
jgi:general stress protein 26